MLFCFPTCCFFLIHIHWSYNLFCQNLIWVTHVIFYPNNKSVYSIVMLSTFQLTFPNFLGQVGCSGCWFPFPQPRKWPEDAFKNEQLNLFTSFPWGVAILLERHNQPMATRVLDFFSSLAWKILTPRLHWLSHHDMWLPDIVVVLGMVNFCFPWIFLHYARKQNTENGLRLRQLGWLILLDRTPPPKKGHQEWPILDQITKILNPKVSILSIVNKKTQLQLHILILGRCLKRNQYVGRWVFCEFFTGKWFKYTTNYWLSNSIMR